MLISSSCLSRFVWSSFLNDNSGVFILFIYSFLSLFTCFTYSEVIPLDSNNFDDKIGAAQIALVNFYADWCRFSAMLKPIFQETAAMFENQTSNVVFGSVDCIEKADLAKRYNINKFPTLKYFRYGELSRREYRGARSIDALKAFVEENLKPVFTPVYSKNEIETQIDQSHRSIFAYLSSLENSVEIFNLEKIASNLREDCKFYLGVGSNFQEELKHGNSVVFRPARGTKFDEISLSGAMLHDFNYLKRWITDKCIPLVRELLFSNAEELTEEGLPFLILFRNPDDPNDKVILEKFTEQVAVQLHEHKAYINPLHADGLKFAHPLHHLGKSTKDLPLIAIDSFTHMYIFPDIKKLEEPNALKQFVLDLYSGKLHREFHNGPDPTLAPITHPGQQVQYQGGRQTDPPSSIFSKLKPSESRYTLLRDEL